MKNLRLIFDIYRPQTIIKVGSCFALPLLEQDENLKYLQTPIGFNRSKTIERYTQILTPKIEIIINPLDTFNHVEIDKYLLKANY